MTKPADPLWPSKALIDLAAQTNGQFGKLGGTADPRKAKSIEDACSNGDGTFNGYRLMSFLSEAMNPGKGFSVEEVEAMARKGKVKTEKAK